MEKDFIKVGLSLKHKHIDLLKRIDPDNLSNAQRIVDDSFIKQKRLMNFEKYLSTFAFGIILVGIGTILPNLYVSITTILTGSFCIFYSLFMYSRGRIRYEQGR